MQTNFPQLYSDFGVTKYTKKLEKEKDLISLNKLHKILAKYIVTQAINDLSDQAIKKLETLDLKNNQQLFSFLNKHIPNFSDKIKEYGRRFRNAYPRIGNTE